MFNDAFITNTKEWVLSNVNHVSENEGTGEFNIDGVNDDDDVNPEDSVSNVGKNSNKSDTSNKIKSVTSNRSSTTSPAKIEVAAERAALVARTAALKEGHALEEQEQQIRRIKEQLGALPLEVKHPLILSKDQHISMLSSEIFTNYWVTVVETIHCTAEEILDYQCQLSCEEDHI